MCSFYAQETNIRCCYCFKSIAVVHCLCCVFVVLLLAPTVSGLTISPTVVMQHDDMSLHCPFSIRNCNCDNIIWYKDNTILQTNTPNHIQTASKSIVHIKRVTTRDSGYYRCEAQVNGRVVRNSQAKLMVQRMSHSFLISSNLYCIIKIS